MSITGMPSVIATTSVMPASAASRIASALAGRRDKDHGGAGASFLDGLPAGVEDRHAQDRLASPAGVTPPTRFVP